jgi:hypothetical protein
MKMFRGLPLGAVFLQNNITDLLLGIGIKEVFTGFVQHIESKYRTRAGFMTLNMPRIITCLESAGIERPLVCAAVNKSGFQMNPDVASYENALRAHAVDTIAMSVMAGGALSPWEAFEYVAKIGVDAIIFGASSRAHIEQTREIVGELSWRDACQARAYAS